MACGLGERVYSYTLTLQQRTSKGYILTTCLQHTDPICPRSIVRLLQLGREVEQAIALHAQEVAGSAIRDLVSDNHHNMALAAKADGIEPLVDILIQGSERGKEIAANALVNLAGVTESVRRIINAGAIEPMVTMLQR